MSARPTISSYCKLNEFVISLLRQINPRDLGLAVADSKNPPVAPIVLVGVVGVALVLVIPIDEINRAIRTFHEVHDLRPLVVEENRIGRMLTDKTRAASLQDIHVQACSMDVAH